MSSTPSPHPVVCSKTSGTQNNQIQDSHSGHSQNTGDRNHQRSPAAISSSAANNYENKQHDNNTSMTRMNLIKTEYKSNFTPFDQYVYNEVTDTFVKQQHCKTAASNNLLIESRSNHPLSASSSNHDLSGNSMAHGVETRLHHSTSRRAAGAVSPAGIETGLFEPPVNGTEQHDVTSEPWYMEVMKRNERAHEYRFKSEIGHNSPLLKSGPSNEDLIRKSPLGNDPLTEAQIQEHQQLAAGTLDSTTGNSKQTFRFSPHDYKRDHLIAHMANNNNFKLPKDANDEPAGRVASTRRVPVTQTNASSRPLSRTTAASRARSQSSRRQVAGAIGATSSARAEPATKSNQTTPVKSVPSRVSTTTTRLARTNPAKTTTTATTTTTRPAARPTTATTRVSAAKTPLGAAQNGTTRPSAAAPATRRPLTTTTTTTRTTPLRSTTTTTTTRPAAASSTRAPAAPRSTVPAAASRTVTRTTTTTASTAARSPVKRVGTTSATSRPTTARQSPLATSRNSSTRTSTSKAPASSEEASPNAVKSIKTRALVDAGQKAAAVAASAAAVTATAGALAQEFDPKPTAAEATSEIAPKQERLEQETLANVFDETATVPPARPQLFNYMTSEPDLFFTTTEAGNMLADEIAQAERAADENLMREQQMIGQEVPATPQPATEPESNKSAPESEASELVNGLAGGLVSTEDRYDSSERDGSFDGFAAQQTDQANNQQGLSSNDDEPYSIIPTNYDSDKHNDQFIALSDDKQQQLEPQTQQPGDETEGISKIEEPLDQKLSGEQAVANLVRDANVSNLDHLRPKRSVDVDGEQDEQPTVLQEPGVEESENEEQQDGAVADSNKEALLTDDVNSSRRMSSSGDTEDIPEKESAESSKPEESFMAKGDDEPAHFGEADDDEFERNLSRDDLTTETDIPGGASETSPTHDDTLVKNEVSVTAPDATIRFDRDDTLERVEPAVESAPVSDDMSKRGTEEQQESSQGQQVLSDEVNKLEQQQQTETISAPDETRETTDVSAQQQSDQHVGGTQAHDDDDRQAPAASNDDATREAQAEPESEAELEHETDGIDKGELLMNVADLMEIETIKKQEMSKKAELAREQSNSRGSLNLLQTGEILLSPDQLSEQFAQLATGDETTAAADDYNKSQTEKQAQEEQPETDVGFNIDESQQATQSRDFDLPEPGESPQETTIRQVEKSEDLLNFGSVTPTNNQSEEFDAGARRFDTFEVVGEPLDDEHERAESKHDAVVNLHENLMMDGADNSEDLDINLEADSTRATKSTTSVNDDEEVDLEEDEEQQKLSNHLTNSDDDVILEPRNTKRDGSMSEEFGANVSMNISPPFRYNEGAGLGLLAREERVAEERATTELADGLSAEIVAPTVAENRVEVATSKSMMPGLSQAATFTQPPKLTREDDSDSDDLELNPNADPIDVAATMSPSSSVAEEMLRLSRQASSGGVTTIDQLDDHEQQRTSADWPEHGRVTGDNKLGKLNESCKEEEPVDKGTNLLGSSSESLSSQKDLAQELVNKTIGDTLQTLVAGSPLVADRNARDSLNNNEITSDNNSGSRKQSVDRNGDSVQSRDATGLVEEAEGQEDAPESVDRSGPGMTNGATAAAAVAKDDITKVTVPTD